MPATSRRAHRLTLGVLLDRLEDEYQNEVLAGLEAGAAARGANLICLCGGILGSPQQSGRERNFLFDIIDPGTLDGLVVMSGSISNHVGAEGVADYCKRFASLPMCSIGVRLPRMSNVLIDNASGLQQSIEGLIERGQRRRVAFIRGPEQNEEAEIRYHVYRHTLARLGVAFDPELVVGGNFQKESGERAVELLLDQRRQSFDAIVAASDYMALGAIEALLRRAVSVPREVAVSGFDDVEDARFAAVPLSTVRQPLREQGERAVQLLLDQIESGIEAGDVLLPTAVVVRDSCGLLGSRPSLKGVSGAAEYEQAQERLGQARQIHALRRSGQALSSALSEHDVLDATRRELSGIGIRRALLCLFEPPSTSPQYVRRIRINAEERAEGVGSTREELIQIGQILERQPWQAEARYSAVAEPLFSNEQTLGVGVFEVGPLQGTVYEFLREQISAALYTAALVKQLVNETTRRVAAEKEQTERELQIAVRIQTGILPRELRAPGLTLCAGMIAAAQVGGDYYDVLPVVDGCWLCIGDVAGHGLSTGLVMLMVQSIVAGISARSPDAAPSELLAVLNQVLYHNVRDRLQRDEHATVTLIRYTRDGKLVLAGGHEDLVVCRAKTGRCELLPTPGPWVGAFRDVGDSNIDSHYQLHVGDVLLLYTDGVTEAMDTAGRQFGLERLCDEFAHVHRESVEVIHRHLMRRVLGWQLSQADDITLVVARYLG